MRYFSISSSICLSICVCLLSPSIAFASALRNLRPLDSLAAEAIERVIEGSETGRTLVARLESSNVIVHVESSRHLPSGIGGLTRFVASRSGYRYLRITISNELHGRTRIALLAHELQHACEVANSDADDEAELRKVFEHQGHRSGDFFETAAAISAEKNVSQELRVTRALQAEPVVKFNH